MLTEFLILEYDFDKNTDDCYITNNINKQLDDLYENYEIVDFKVNVVNSKDRGLYNKLNYPCLIYSLLIKFDSYKENN